MRLLRAEAEARLTEGSADGVEELSTRSPSSALGGNPAGRWFGNLPVGAKISTALAVALLAGLIASVIGMFGLSTVNGNATDIYQENLQPTAALASAQGSFDDEIFGLAMMNIASSETGVEQSRQAALAAADLVVTGVKAYEDLGLDAAQAEPASQLQDGLTAFNKVRDEQLIPAAAKNSAPTPRSTAARPPHWWTRSTTPSTRSAPLRPPAPARPRRTPRTPTTPTGCRCWAA
ncbi:MCP four helix bundle domain-containing protein [Actinoplanes sp. NPDC026619]|uniref:MCP four helix bundle domain-containing protein n=1 Tax=Actinoplanes sp. NPDC026619 TaxID=3155798 RepID=UPI0033DCA052